MSLLRLNLRRCHRLRALLGVPLALHLLLATTLLAQPLVPLASQADPTVDAAPAMDMPHCHDAMAADSAAADPASDDAPATPCCAQGCHCVSAPCVTSAAFAPARLLRWSPAPAPGNSPAPGHAPMESDLRPPIST